jgi:hypothetical protein
MGSLSFRRFAILVEHHGSGRIWLAGPTLLARFECCKNLNAAADPVSTPSLRRAGDIQWQN